MAKDKAEMKGIMYCRVGNEEAIDKKTVAIYCRAASKKDAEREQKLARERAKQLNAVVKAVFVDIIPEQTDPQDINDYCKKHGIDFVIAQS